LVGKTIFLFLVLAFGFSQKVRAVDPLKLYQDSLRQWGKSILSRQSLSERKPANEKMQQALYKILQSEAAWNYPFDSLGAIGVLVPADKAFRIFNWEFPLRDGTYEYFAFFQFPPQQGQCKVVELEDSRASIKSPERAKLKPENWFGAHYYQLFFKVHKKKKTYFLLGLDWNNKISRKKIIEPFTINPGGDISFGANVFNGIGVGLQRMIFEYSAELSMSLRYNEKRELIIFDHLVPKSPELKGQYQFYAPDLSYDALKFRKGKWQLKENIDARNEISELDDKPTLRKKLPEKNRP
jgi:hypothetical protein